MVIRKVLGIFVIFLFGVWVIDADVSASNFAASSCSYSAVQAAINKASIGDIVTVPPGSCTWDNPLVIDKAITLQGAGVGKTNITGNITDVRNGVISYKPGSKSLSANSLARITGFTINCGGKSNGIYVSNYEVTPVTKLRIDHNRVYNTANKGGSRAVYIIGNVFGVADNNKLENFYHGMDSEGHSSGIPQWNDFSRKFGSADNFYFEDNTLIADSSDVFFAGGHGGRYVARYNNLVNNYNGNIFPVFDMHGNQPSDIAAMMVCEIYGNDVNLGSGSGRLVDQRGGMLMAFWNKFTYGGDTPSIMIREEYRDSNYPSGNSYLMHVTNSYYWNNKMNNKLLSSATVISNQYEDTHDLSKNKDFWFHNLSYNGTTETGVYCGSSLPSNCTSGDGAWITDQSCSDLTGMVGVNPPNPVKGIFYKCKSTNTWAAYYKPLTYPHPLRSLDNNSLAAPTGLTVIEAGQ